MAESLSQAGLSRSVRASLVPANRKPNEPARVWHEPVVSLKLITNQSTSPSRPAPETRFRLSCEVQLSRERSSCFHYTNQQALEARKMFDFEDLNDDIIADDWLIPQEELTRRQIIRSTAHFNIYKADWFGDVLVYEPRFKSETGDEKQESQACTSLDTTSDPNWFELNELRLVAHEGFMLFMGATMRDAHNEQNSSLVIEMLKPKSKSLFDLLHANKSRPTSPLNRFFGSNCRQQPQLLSIADKLNICQQVTNAMTYLHDKHIVHGRLTSVNIFIESNQRVKISLIDNDERPIASCDPKQANGGRKVAFNLPTLTYLSPELVRTIKMQSGPGAVPADAQAATNGQADNSGSNVKRLTQRGHLMSGDRRVQVDPSLLTMQADIYSFGTLLFELFEERFPFALDDDNTTQTILPRRSPSPPALSSTKLFDTLCLANHSPASSSSRSSLYSTLHLQTTPLSPTRHTRWNGNIKSSACELIFQIGSGQISHRNRLRNKCPALVDHIISACWSAEPGLRPSFKQMRYD